MRSGDRRYFHRLHPRPHRAAADRGAAAGTAIGAGPHLAADRDGRDGLDAGARTQPAAVGDRQLSERLAPAAGGQRPTSTRPRCATRSTRPPIRRCAPARSSAGCAISSRAARASGGWKASPSWSRRRARWRWSASRTAASACNFSFDPTVDLVLADRVQIQQVLLNLIRNAMDAMEDSPTRELIDFGRRRPTTIMVAVSVARHRLRHRAGDRRAAVPAFRHDQAPGHGRRPVDLAHDRRSAWRTHLGGAQSRRRHDFPVSRWRR